MSAIVHPRRTTAGMELARLLAEEGRRLDGAVSADELEPIGEALGEGFAAAHRVKQKLARAERRVQRDEPGG